MEYKFEAFDMEFDDTEGTEDIVQRFLDDLSEKGWIFKDMQATGKALFLMFERPT